MKKGSISNILRALRLIYLTDRLRFHLQRFKNRKINIEFKQNNPKVILPPDYLMYESFQINYKEYYSEGNNTAKWVVGLLSNHKELKNLKILDWGCGPGRIIRHLPEIIGNDCDFYCTDYNSNSIKWCAENLPGINFNNNSLQAELPYPDDYFDIIYGLSVLTHLSEQMHFDWYNELHRILKIDGIMLLTTQGNNFKFKLTDAERTRFDNGELVIRGKVKEGHRTYSAFHPKAFMVKLFHNVEISEHIEQAPEEGKWLPQDVWIVKKRN